MSSILEPDSVQSCVTCGKSLSSIFFQPYNNGVCTLCVMNKSMDESARIVERCLHKKNTRVNNLNQSIECLIVD